VRLSSLFASLFSSFLLLPSLTSTSAAAAMPRRIWTGETLLQVSSEDALVVVISSRRRRRTTTMFLPSCGPRGNRSRWCKTKERLTCSLSPSLPSLQKKPRRPS
jgi:hypothetical protein